ncbi:MAG: hypothetical protein ACUVTM_00715 [Candidatus Bathyarchaeia archaeon]
MSLTYRRMILRWTSRPALASAGILLTSTLLIEVLYIDYMLARGLEGKTIQAGYLSLPYPYIPIIGVLMVLLTSWMHMARSRAFVKARPNIRLPESLMHLRMVEATFLLLTIFAGTLYIPYLLGSNWMILGLANLESTLPALRDSISGFYGGAVNIMGLPPVLKYGLSQVASCIIVVASASALSRRATGRVRAR